MFFPGLLISPLYPAWFMPGSAPVITHVSHLSHYLFDCHLPLTLSCVLWPCRTVFRVRYQYYLPVGATPIPPIPLSFFPYLCQNLYLVISQYSDRYDISLDTSPMFILTFLGMAVCCYVARRSMARMFESVDWSGRMVPYSPVPHVPPWELGNTPYCCPSIFFW